MAGFLNDVNNKVERLDSVILLFLGSKYSEKLRDRKACKKKLKDHLRNQSALESFNLQDYEDVFSSDDDGAEVKKGK